MVSPHPVILFIIPFWKEYVKCVVDNSMHYREKKEHPRLGYSKRKESAVHDKSPTKCVLVMSKNVLLFVCDKPTWLIKIRKVV